MALVVGDAFIDGAHVAAHGLDGDGVEVAQELQVRRELLGGARVARDHPPGGALRRAVRLGEALARPPQVRHHGDAQAADGLEVPIRGAREVGGAVEPAARHALAVAGGVAAEVAEVVHRVETEDPVAHVLSARSPVAARGVARALQYGKRAAAARAARAASQLTTRQPSSCFLSPRRPGV